VPFLPNAIAIAAGDSHGLALKSDGTVAAWGLNANGQTVVPFGLTNVVAIAAGANHSIALKADGKVVAWGLNTSGQTTVPTNLTDVVAIAAGTAHTMALRRDGTVVAWGSNAYGQTSVDPLSGVVGIAAGAQHSLALKNDGSIVAWGAGLVNNNVYPNFGQSIIPLTVTNCSQVFGGSAHTLALAADGAPFISEVPANRFVYSGRSIALRAAATGLRPLSYQWQFNGTNILGATNQILAFSNVASTASGLYHLVVSNALGSAASPDALLTVVDAAPFVITQPVGSTNFLASAFQLQVVADGSGPFSYQWRLNGTNIAGATSSTYAVSRGLISMAGNYSVVLSNTFGVVSSVKANVVILQVVAWGAGTNTVISNPNY